jgi:hypothetical protein
MHPSWAAIDKPINEPNRHQYIATWQADTASGGQPANRQTLRQGCPTARPVPGAFATRLRRRPELTNLYPLSRSGQWDPSLMLYRVNLESCDPTSSVCRVSPAIERAQPTLYEAGLGMKLNAVRACPWYTQPVVGSAPADLACPPISHYRIMQRHRPEQDRELANDCSMRLYRSRRPAIMLMGVVASAGFVHGSPRGSCLTRWTNLATSWNSDRGRAPCDRPLSVTLMGRFSTRLVSRRSTASRAAQSGNS